MRNLVHERTVVRQKLNFLKLLELNVANQKQVKMSCKYLDSTIDQFNDKIKKIALDMIVNKLLYTKHKELANQGSVKIFTILQCVLHRQSQH